MPHRTAPHHTTTTPQPHHAVLYSLWARRRTQWSSWPLEGSLSTQRRTRWRWSAQAQTNGPVDNLPVAGRPTRVRPAYVCRGSMSLRLSQRRHGGVAAGAGAAPAASAGGPPGQPATPAVCRGCKQTPAGGGGALRDAVEMPRPACRAGPPFGLGDVTHRPNTPLTLLPHTLKHLKLPRYIGL